jgi:hypothetical protein
VRRRNYTLAKGYGQSAAGDSAQEKVEIEEVLVQRLLRWLVSAAVPVYAKMSAPRSALEVPDICQCHHRGSRAVYERFWGGGILARAIEEQNMKLTSHFLRGHQRLCGARGKA